MDNLANASSDPISVFIPSAGLAWQAR